MSSLTRTARTLASAARPGNSVRGLHSTRVARDHYINASPEEFKQVIGNGSGKITLLQFTASWCQPCRMLGPILQRMTKPGTNYDLVVVDIDNEMEFSEEHKVRAVPYVVAFKDGKKVDSFTGMQPESKIQAFLDKL